MKIRLDGFRNVTEIEEQSEATRWEKTTAMKMRRMESITEMKRKKVRNKITSRTQRDKEKGQRTEPSPGEGPHDEDITVAITTHDQTEQTSLRLLQRNTNIHLIKYKSFENLLM